jgi:hypothetical protein
MITKIWSIYVCVCVCVCMCMSLVVMVPNPIKVDYLLAKTV